MRTHLFIAFSIIIVACSVENKSNQNTITQIDTNITDEISNSKQLVAVDLGLSVLWANMNVGAETPTDCGDYYSWGEIETKERYINGTYKWEDENGKYTKYCIYPQNGDVDNRMVLELTDDVAHTQLGSSWRMPTTEEFDELINNCEWTKVAEGKNSYFKITAKNGNYIILPAAGRRESVTLHNYNERASYWSSSLSKRYSGYAYSLCADGNGAWQFDNSERYMAMSIRAVKEANYNIALLHR